MAAPFRLSQVAACLCLFSTLTAALPPAVQPRTAPDPPAPPATQITTTSLAPASTDTTRPTTTATAAGFAIPRPASQPPTALAILEPVLELRSEPAVLVTATDTVDESSTITALTLPSGFSNAQEWQEKWYQTTYWSCVTDAVQTHCGWHEPVLPGGDNSVAGAVLERRPRPFFAAGVAVVGAVLATAGWGDWGF